MVSHCCECQEEWSVAVASVKGGGRGVPSSCHESVRGVASSCRESGQ